MLDNIKRWFKSLVMKDAAPECDPFIAGPYHYVDPHVKACVKIMRKLEAQYEKLPEKAVVARARIEKKYRATDKLLSKHFQRLAPLDAV